MVNPDLVNENYISELYKFFDDKYNDKTREEGIEAKKSRLSKIKRSYVSYDDEAYDEPQPM